jgi:hypothetical protein
MSALAVSPVNSNLLLAGGGSGARPCRSIDGGNTWSALGSGANSIHADHRAIAFNNTGMAFIGGDGGIFSSTDQGVNWTSAGSLAMSAPTIMSYDMRWLERLIPNFSILCRSVFVPRLLDRLNVNPFS